MEDFANTGCLDDIDMIKEIFKLSPEFGAYICSKANRVNNFLDEVVEDIHD